MRKYFLLLSYRLVYGLQKRACVHQYVIAHMLRLFSISAFRFASCYEGTYLIVTPKIRERASLKFGLASLRVSGAGISK